MKRLSPTSVWTLAVPSALALLAWWGGLVEAADTGLYDRLLAWQATRQPAEPKPYVLVEIDDRSIEALGRFPWSRSTFARLLDRTREGGARVVGIDVLFSESADPEGDEALARSLERAGNTVLASAPILAEGEGGAGAGALGRLPGVERVVEPIPELKAAAAGVGGIFVLEDPDGSLRRYSVLVRHGTAPYPSMAQLMAGIVAGSSTGSVSVRGDGTLLINYGGLSPGAILRISFADALGYGSDEARELFADRIVMVGTNYTGGVDYGPTPLSPRTPRVLAQIYALHTLLTGERIREAGAGVPLLLTILVVGLLSSQIPTRHPIRLLKMGGVLAVVVVAGSFVVFVAGGVAVGPTLPVLTTGLVLSGYGLEQWWSTNLHLKRRNLELQETLENLRRTRSAKERMEAELNVAREIQFSMLPLEFPPFPDRTEFELHAKLIPAREVGGDFYDFFLLDDDRLYVCVADVSDKGVPAALFMAVSKAILKSAAGREASPGEILTRANAELAEDNEASMFVTVWLGILDLRSGRMSFANAGHNPPYVWTAEGELIRLESRQGPPVAVMGGIEYQDAEVHLAQGDVLFLYTDGVPEAMDAAGTLFGEERLRACIRSWDRGRVEELVEETAHSVSSFEGSESQADDLTLLGLRFRGPVAAPPDLLQRRAGLDIVGDDAPVEERGHQVTRGRKVLPEGLPRR